MERNVKSMTMKSILSILLITSLFVISCGPTYEKPTDASETAFAISFFKNVNAVTPKVENVVVSPYSAAVALSMLAEGAQGQTRVELDNALGGMLFKAADLGSNDTVVVKSANSVWIDDNFSPRNRYVSLLEKDFDAFLTTLNFADPATLRAINNWCAENTAGKITEILDRLDPSNVMVLINALYVILPPEGSDINKLIPKATETIFNSAVDALQMQEVRFFMPRFKVETSMLLNKPLQNMGIKTAFTSAADFSGIAEMGPLVVAAAVTAIQIKLTSARHVVKLPVMRVDRPFVFLIADGETNNILFAGKIVNL